MSFTKSATEKTRASKTKHNTSLQQIVQTKLRVNPAGDKFEVEADNIADQVMRTPAGTNSLQRNDNPDEEDIQTKSAVPKITPLIQRQIESEEPEIEADDIIQRQHTEELNGGGMIEINFLQKAADGFTVEFRQAIFNLLLRMYRGLAWLMNPYSAAKSDEMAINDEIVDIANVEFSSYLSTGKANTNLRNYILDIAPLRELKNLLLRKTQGEGEEGIILQEDLGALKTLLIQYTYQRLYLMAKKAGLEAYGEMVQTGDARRKTTPIKNMGEELNDENDTDPGDQPEPSPDSDIQRKCETCEQEEKVQRKEEFLLPTNLLGCEPCDQMDQIQAKSDLGVHEPTNRSQTMLNAVLKNGGGQPMDPVTRQFMESRLGGDFGNVRIHTDYRAAQSAKAIHAKAYTHGNQIVFAQGHYQPYNTRGKWLLAHELVHVLQQGGEIQKGLIQNKEDGTSTVKSGTVCGVHSVSANEPKPESNNGETTDIPENMQERDSSTAKETYPATNTPEATEKTDEPKTPVSERTKTSHPKSAKEDPEFQELISETNQAKFSQQRHKLGAEKAMEGQLAATPNESLKETTTAKAGQLETESAAEKTFNKEAFIAEVLAMVAKEVPADEGRYKSFKKEEPSKHAQKALQKISSNKEAHEPRSLLKNGSPSQTEVSKNLVHDKEVVPLKPEIPGRRPSVGNTQRAIPKPMPGEELAMDEEHNAESLDRAMKDEKLRGIGTELTEQQLKDSNEGEFQATLSTKWESQKELCKTPDKLRKHESETHQKATEDAQTQLKGALKDMHSKRSAVFDVVHKNKSSLKSEDEKLLNKYYKEIDLIFKNTTKGVTQTLQALDNCVSCILEQAMHEAHRRFKNNVTDRLEDYYGVGVFNLSDEDEDWEERSHNQRVKNSIYWLGQMKKQTQDPRRRAEIDKQIETLASTRKETIVDKIFKEERNKFTAIISQAVNKIADKIDEGLRKARKIIKNGKDCVKAASCRLPGHLQEKAQEKTTIFLERFNNLESRVQDKQNELKETLVRSYVENLKKLKTKFEEIRAEAALSFWERAWRAIKKVATIIFDLGKLLVRVLSKAASVIGDILAHPIRFVGNLISAVGQGMVNFRDRIGHHLEQIMLKLILGTLPPGVSLPRSLDPKPLFSFALDVIGLSKQNIRTQMVKRLGEPVVSKLESAFDLLIIFKREGLAGLWSHVKDRIGDLKEQVIDQVKDYFKNAIIRAAIKFLLAALTPASGFIKACQTIISIATFFIKNLRNLLQLLDSILDSFIDIARGNLTAAANKVERALADILVTGLRFLAALVGINLDKISRRVRKIFESIRRPVKRAINWLLGKAVAFAHRTGLIGLAEKGRRKLASTKEKVKRKAKAVASKIASWWNLRKKFKTSDGQDHVLFFKGKSLKATLMVASTPQSVSSYLSKLKVTPSKQAALKKAQAIAAKIDSIKAQKVSTDKDRKKQQKTIEKQMDLMAPFIAKLIEGEKLPESTPPVYGGLRNGFGTSMRIDVLTKKGPEGSVPKVANTETYDHLNLRRFSKFSSSFFYVKGHLLNHNLHGPGTTWANLTPLSVQGNKNHSNKVEEPIKNLVDDGEIVKYKVVAEFGRTHTDRRINEIDEFDPLKENKIKVLEAERSVPTGLFITAETMDKDDRLKSKKINVPPFVENPIQEERIDHYAVKGEALSNEIDLNTANQKQLTRLKGVGNATADLLIDARRKNISKWILPVQGVKEKT